MALEKGRVAVPLAKGINQKIDPKQDPPGSLETLENIQVSKYGEIEKREGYEKVQERYGYTSSTTTYPITNIQAITSFKDELHILTDNKALSNFQGLGKAIFQGKYSPAKVETQWITQQQAYDCVHHNVVVKGDYSYSVFSLITSSTTAPVYIVVRNVLDDTHLVSLASISSTAYDKPKIISLGDKIVKFAIEKDSTNYYVVYNMASPLDYDELTSTSWTRLTQTHADKVYDVTGNEAGTAAAVVHKTTSGESQVLSIFLDTDPTVGDVLGFQSSFTSTSTTVTAVGVTPITTNPRKNGVYTSTQDEGGFCVVYGDSTMLAVTTFDELGMNIHVNTSFTHSGSTGNQFNLPIGPTSIIGIARDNNWSTGGTNGLTYDIYSTFDITATSSTNNNRLWTIDNTTGTYAVGNLLATSFSGGTANIKQTGSSTTTFQDISYADFPAWNKQRTTLYRQFANIDGSGAGNYAYAYACVGAGLAAKPYLVDGDPIVLVGRNPGDQNSYYLYAFEDYDTTINRPVGVVSYGTADAYHPFEAGVDGLSGLASVGEHSSGSVHLPINTLGRIQSNDKAFFTLAVPAITKITYDYSVANQSVEVAGNLLVAGSQVFGSDQMRFQEFNFVSRPSKLFIDTTSMTTSGGKFPQNDVYSYYAVYRYEDASGKIHRSGLSDVFTFKNPVDYDNIDILIPMVNLTAKYQYSTFIELYRTTDEGSVYYKVSDQAISSTVLASSNNKERNYIKIRDTIGDSSLQDNEILYTTGGVLENSVVGAASIITTFKNRVFVAGLEDSPDLVKYSKLIGGQVYSPAPVEFANELVLEVPTLGGKIVAMRAMDDKLIVFKERAIYMIAGEGPVDTGEQNDYIDPQLVTTDIGCKFANGVASTPKGLMFMSNKGIYLLNRSQGLEYIGAPAEDYNDLTITKATVVSKKNEVRFLSSDGPTIIYNYFLEMWYTYDDHRGNSSCLVGNDYHLATFKDKVYKQVSTTASFDGAMVPIKLTTGWLSFAGVQGFQRVYRMLILGEYRSPHKLQIKVAYNYDDVWHEEKLIDVAGYTQWYPYGGPTTGTQDKYGDPSTSDASGHTAIAYGGKDNNQYQIRLNFQKQKCEAIKIQITEVEGSNPAGNSESAGPGFNLSNLSFIVGVKKGDFRIKEQRVFGSLKIT